MGVMLVVPAVATAKPSLWLYPDSDDPRAGGHRVEGGTFILNIQNRANGNGDNTAYEVFLVVSVNDPGLLNGGTLTLEDGTSLGLDGLVSGTPTYTCSGREIPRHGVFPADYTTILLGDIEANMVVRIDVEVDGADGLEVHFDAFGYSIKSNPNHGDKCQDLVNPFGHDVTAIFGGEEEGEDDCPSVEILKEASVSEVAIGDEIEYVITVINTGDSEGDEGEKDEGDEASCDLTEVVLTEDIPVVVTEDEEELPAFSIVALDPSASEESDTELSWQLDTMAPGDEVSVTVTVLFEEEAADGTEVVNTACIDAAELDEPVCSSFTVTVGEVTGEDRGHGPGYWCNQIRFTLEGRHNAQHTVEDLEAWLAEINDTSDVFGDLVIIDTLEAAQALLCEASDATEPDAKLARHLLTLWLNMVSGMLDGDLSLEELCGGMAELPEDTDTSLTISDVLLAAESDLVSDEADDATLLLWTEIIDFINHSEPAGEEGCEEADDDDGEEVTEDPPQESRRIRSRRREHN
jgi:hypothetical protein